MQSSSTMDRHAESDRRLGAFGRWGTVAEVQGRRCRVKISDSLDTGWIPWLASSSGVFTAWRAPTIGEQGMVVFPEADIGQGLFLPGVYSDEFPEPAAQPDQLVLEMKGLGTRGGLRLVLGVQDGHPVAVIRTTPGEGAEAEPQVGIVVRDDHLSLLFGTRFFSFTEESIFVRPPVVEILVSPFADEDAEALSL